MELADLEALASPFMPLASRALIRAHYEAERRGLVCVPVSYPLVVGDNAGGVGGSTAVTLPITIPQAEGALVVTQVAPPRGHQRQNIRFRVNGLWRTDGPVRAYDSLFIPRDYCGRLMSSPICVQASQQLAVALDDVDPYFATDGVQVNGLGVRSMLSTRRQLCEAPTDLARDWVNAVAMGGEWWALTVVADAAAPSPAVVTDNVIVECVVLAQQTARNEGEGTAINLDIKVGGHDMIPIIIGPGILGNDVVEGTGDDIPDEVVVLPGLRWPISGNTEVSVKPSYASTTTTPMPVRVTFIGRRGGIAGACW